MSKNTAIRISDEDYNKYKSILILQGKNLGEDLGDYIRQTVDDNKHLFSQQEASSE